MFHERNIFLLTYFILKSPFLPKKWIFLVNFIRILWFIRNLLLVLFDSHQDAVSQKILVFGKILDFPEVNWAQKWTKIFNFGYAPFALKKSILKDCLETDIFLWETTSSLNFSKLVPHLGEKGLRNSPKGWFHGCYITRKTFDYLYLDSYKR